MHAAYVIGDYFEQISVMFPRRAVSPFAYAGEVRDRMESFAGEGDGRVITHVAEGRPYAEIVRLAAETDADLIVIGTSVHASLFAEHRPSVQRLSALCATHLVPCSACLPEESSRHCRRLPDPSQYHKREASKR